MDRILFGALLLLGVGVLSVRYLDQKGRAPANAAPVLAVSPSSNTMSANTRSFVVQANGGILRWTRASMVAASRS
jgi:hypothetical protein